MESALTYVPCHVFIIPKWVHLTPVHSLLNAWVEFGTYSQLSPSLSLLNWILCHFCLYYGTNITSWSFSTKTFTIFNNGHKHGIFQILFQIKAVFQASWASDPFVLWCVSLCAWSSASLSKTEWGWQPLAFSLPPPALLMNKWGQRQRVSPVWSACYTWRRASILCGVPGW